MGSRATARFTLVLVAVLAALVGIQVLGVHVQRAADRAADDRVRLAGHVQLIRYYDELLTMSARLAASSGDTTYVDRYKRAVPELDRVIADAFQVVSDHAAQAGLRETDGANQALIALEQQSFDLLASGDREGAYRAVTSPQYVALKADYLAGMEVALARLALAGEQQQRTAAQRQQVALAVGVGAAVLLALLWAVTARGLGRSQQARGRVEEQLRVQAHADPLTGLANRRLFREQLAAALAESDGGGLAVMFADLDHFKTVNDTRGHAEGDALLVEVAERLTDVLHGHRGAAVARLGGDEFALLLPGVDEDSVAALADRLVAALARPYAAAPQIPVTASVGVAVASEGAREAGTLLRGADLAMYAAKAAGRGRWNRYADHMHTDLLARVELESELRQGIARGELAVHYQPTYDLRTLGRHGVEALVRWQHPRRGLLLPAAFLPLAEQTGLIVDLGRHVLAQACRQLAHWPTSDGERPPAEVAVNVSPHELGQPGFVSHVLLVVRESGLEPSRLILEITESSVMSSPADVVEALDELRHAGVRIAIDDFGLGHSSLSRLHQLPVDQIKIDRSFVLLAAPDGEGEGDTTMLELVVTLAQRLNLAVVAEGIETERQLAAVREVGCHHGQGFLLGRPLPAASELPQTVPAQRHSP